MLPERMSRAELRAGASLAGVYGLRMLGLFSILPVFAVHAAKLKGADLALVGIALGVYGLSQGILQIPFGLASDRWGRKPAIYTGLVIFAAGSFLGVAAHDIWTAIPAKKPHEEGGGRLFDPELLRLNAGIFVLHVVLYAMFVVVPPLVVHAGLELPEHWKLYLPVLLVSFALMVPPVLYADRRNRPKPVLLGGVALLLAVEAALAATKAGSLAALAALMLAFFVAFNLLEAMLPALVSRLAPSRGRGVAIGVYNTTQTLGVFFGGLFGGWIGRDYGAAGVFWACAALCAVWLAVAAGMKPLQPAVNELSSLTLSIASGVNVEDLDED